MARVPLLWKEEVGGVSVLTQHRRCRRHGICLQMYEELKSVCLPQLKGHGLIFKKIYLEAVGVVVVNELQTLDIWGQSDPLRMTDTQQQ